MALTRRQFADKLRTMQRGGSKAPMQNVQLPTQTPRTSYRTPSGPAASAPQPQKTPGTDPATLAKAGGILGQLMKGSPDSLELDKASSANLGQIGGMMGLLQGSDVDVASNLAQNTAGNLASLPQPSMLGNGVPIGSWANAAKLGGSVPTGDWATTAGWAGNTAAGELGNLSAVNDAVANATNTATDVASGATDAANASTHQLPGVGTALGVGLNAAQGKYGKAAGQAVGAGAGSMFGPMGTVVGGTIGGILGGFFD